MRPSTQIRLGMISIGAIGWTVHQVIHFFLFNEIHIFGSNSHELVLELSVIVTLVVSGELIVYYEKSMRDSRLSISRLEDEKDHIFNVGMFGNSKEIRNKAIYIGQTSGLMVKELLSLSEGATIIQSNSQSIIDILDVQLIDLEKQTNHKNGQA
jgi:hypothetical protein